MKRTIREYDQNNDQIKKNKENKEFTDVIIYIRVSTKNQKDESQEYSCREYCKKYNYNILKIVKEKVSAYKLNKQKELNNILSKESNIILLVSEIDRFSRNSKNGNTFLESMLKKNIILKSVKESFDFNTPEGQHEIRTLISFAQAESDKKSKKIQNSKKFKKSKNHFVGGRTKYGYKIFNKQKVLNELEQAVINFILKNLNKKKSSAELTKELFILLEKYNKPDDFYVPIDFLEKYNTDSENESDLSEDLLDGYFDIIYSEDQKLNITDEMLSNILNDYEILNRNKLWEPNNIKYIFNTNYYNFILTNMFTLTI